MWQNDLRDAFTEVSQLLDFLQLKPPNAPYLLSKSSKFPFLVTKDFAQRMRPQWNDPLLLQVLPREEENKPVNGFVNDAVGDEMAQVIPGLLHKYKSRVLLTPTPACAIHCRYCFRKNFDYQSLIAQPESSNKILSYLKNHPEVNEVILSGGDPLLLTDQQLKVLLKLTQLETIHTVRFHTRVPIVFPSRITHLLLAQLQKIVQNKNLIFVLHINHPQELSGQCLQSIKQLKQVGALLLNQAVLLKGINDTAEIQERLSDRTTELGILPYYLHQLDRVTGTHHFEVEASEGAKIWKELQKNIAGYRLPRYVKEVPGEESKTLIQG